MKNLVRLASLMGLGLLLWSSSGCGRTDIFASAAPRKVSLAPATETVGTGRSIQFTAKVTPARPGDSFQWSVTTPLGGTISSAGLYSAPVSMPAEGVTNFPVVVRAALVGTKLYAEAHLTIVPQQGPLGVTLQKVSGDNQMGSAGQPLAAPLVVRAVDVNGNGFPGLALHFASSLGPSGSADAVTGLDGTAKATVSAGQLAGSQIFIVSAKGVSPVSFTAAIAPGPLAQLLATHPNPAGVINSTLMSPMTLWFRDQFGNPLKGHSGVAQPPEGASAAALTAASDATGGQLFSIRLGPTLGVQEFVFADSQNPSITTKIQFTASATQPASITVVSGENQTGTVEAPIGQPFVVKVTDVNGQPVPGAPISWSTPDGGQFTQRALVTDGAGQAQATVTLGPKAGFQKFMVDAGRIANSPLTILVKAVAGPASQLILQGGQGQSTGAGAPYGQAFSVLAADAYSNPVSAVAVHFAVAAGGGSISPVDTLTGPDGLAQANMVAGAAGGSEVYQASSPGLMNSPITLTLSATVPITYHLNVVSGDGQMGRVGTALPQPLVVQVTSNGQPVANQTVTFGVALGGGTVSPTTVTTGADGKASTTATLGSQPGPQQFAATLPGADNSPVFFNAQASGQVVVALKIISGAGQTAPLSAQLQQPLIVQAIDANGMPVPGVSVTFTPPAGAQVGSPTVTTDQNGQASTTATLGAQAGDQLFLAGVGNVTVTFRETAVMIQEQLVLVSGDGQSAQVGAPLTAPLVVQLVDSTGAPVAGVTVQWQANAPRASVSAGSVITDSMGLAQVSAQLGQPVGQQQFTASVMGAMGSPVTFTETATPAPPSQLLIISGNNQTGLISAALPQPLVVKVVDALGNGVANVTVNFSVGAGGGSLSASTVTTGADGTASVNATLGAMAGMDTFIADAGPLVGSPATFTATATTAMVTGLSISPSNQQVNTGASVSYSAVAIFSDGTTQVVTPQATWSSSNSSVASVSNQMGSQGVAIALAGGTTTITASYAGFIASSVLMVQGTTTLQSIVITPTSASLGVGTTLQFTATGTYSDGSVSDVTQSATWTSSDVTILSVSDSQGAKGLASGVATGQATVTVTLNGVTATDVVNVIQSNLNNLQITPPNVSQPAGTTIDFRATATYANGTVQDVTSQVQWSSSDSTHLAISNAPSPGVANLLLAGTVTVTANLNGQVATETVTITSATLMSLSVAPTMVPMTVNDVAQLKVTGTFSDGSSYDLTNSAVWASDNANVAAVSNTPGSQGLVTALAMGQTQITATVSNMKASASVTVDNANPLILRIFQYGPGGRPMFANGLTCSPGTTIQLAAGTFLQGGGGPFGGRLADVTQDASWSSSNTSIAVVGEGPNSGGLVQCLSAGQVDITAAYKGQTDSTTITVSSATLTQINIAPTSATLAVGDNRAFHAVGSYSDGTTADLTNAVTWTSSAQTVATVSNATGFQGTVSGASPGMATILASYQGVTGKATVTVSDAHLVQIIVSPANTSVQRSRRPQQFTATALYSDGTTQDVTSASTWGSSNTSVAVVANGANAGQAQLVGTGTTQISATYDNMTGTTSLTVF